jgi:hypothetical protein
MVHDVMPPTLRDLIRESDAFKALMKTRPSLPGHLQYGNPWMLWAKTVRNTWVNPHFPTYDLAWKTAVEMMRDHDEIVDVSLISKRVLFAPPRTLLPLVREYNMLGFDWCGRCRRPTKFRMSTSRHHAIRKYAAVTDEDPSRCYFCGQRKISNIYTNR